MREKMNVVSATITKEKELHLIVEKEIKIADFKPLGQMLVDSDDVSFIYLLEKNEQYTYLVMKEELWNLLKDSLAEGLPVFLKNDAGQCELPSFVDELEYLIENIKGNGNYGETMVTKVEALF
ncbi:UPF0738 protein YjbL [Robertmurraya siralis]|uniref:UPF0738 protein YjbL n=1 Tax=Robertmurraya siralis TaxID=77777 RepID=A0A919WJU6_9BACI|nr:hypothetical protein [Robertmurraya siralis]PAE20677.1 hypothetical protein CHH80_10370 [Bacillus sp. 7504-2]GIN62984.1 UPF0738 protein YjbL [Robertmurraya siralis]